MPSKDILLQDKFCFLSHQTETGDLLRSVDWANNPLGPVNNWSQTLLTTLSIIMNSKFPMFLFWGPEHICFYNDAFRLSLGEEGKHPGAMGQKAKDCWPEIWVFLEKSIGNIMGGGEASWFEDELIPIFRNGKIEDVYWTFSQSPVNDEKGKPAGVFVTCTECTDKLKLLKTLNDSKTDLEFAINAAELGTWDLNPVTQHLNVNDRMKSWFGLAEFDSVSLDQAMEVIDIADRERVSATITKAFEFSSGGAFESDYTLINLFTKEARYVRSKGKVLFNAAQQAFSFNGILQDITKETLNQQAIIDSENNFRKLIEQAPLSIAVFKDLDFTITIANKQVLELWGKTAEEVMNVPLFTAVPESKAQGFEELLLQVYTTGERFVARELPVTLSRKGVLHLTYLNFVYEALLNNEGKIDGVMVVATDVTEEVNTRHQIENAEERARLAIDAADLGTFDYDLLTGEVINSPRLLSIFGLEKSSTREEILAAYHPEDSEIDEVAFTQALQSGKLFYEARVIWKNGSLHWIRVEAKIFFDDHKKPNRSIGTVLDITEQKQIADEILKIKQRLEIALEAGLLGSFELDLFTGKIEGSEQFRNNLGLSQNAPLTLENNLKMIVPLYRDKVKTDFNNAIENKLVYNDEYQVKWPDNTLHWIKASAKALYNQNDLPYLFVGVTADITGYKKLQQQKDDFIGVASHELKTPVTSIKTYSQLLHDMLVQKGANKEADMVAKMGVQVNRLSNLITDLLDVNKINSGRLQVNSSSFYFNDLVQMIVADIQIHTPKIKIEQYLLETGFVQSDKERLIQVISNLINNAIKYSPYTNKIIIRTSILNKEIILSVQDFGVGISIDDQVKVFEQFYRASGHMQHTFPGLGLGLYISAEIIKQLGGRIWVNSVEGEGATFCIALPATETESN